VGRSLVERAVNLDAFLHPAFEVRAGERTWDARAVAHEARARASAIERVGGRGSVVEIPADDPASTLAWLGAAWAAGRAPLARAGLEAPRVASLPETDAGLVLHTSGSTGVPKYPEFTLDAVARSAQRIAAYLGLSLRDRVALLQPLEHGYTLVGQLLASAVAGATLVCARSPYPDERAERIVEGKVTVLSGVPFVLRELVDFGLEGCPLRVIGSAGAALPAPLAERLLAEFPGVVVWNQYGCTEAGPRLAACPSTDAAFARGSVGRPIAGVTLSTSNDSGAEGELLFTTDAAMRGYLGNPAATEAARAFGAWRTGDVGRIDADGYVYVTGRTDDIVKVRGLKVSLCAVQSAAERCGAVAALATLVEPSPDGAGVGEEPCLCLVYEAPADIPRAALAEHLPIEALPSRSLRVERLPRLPNGKLDRQAIRSFTRPLARARLLRT